MKSFAARLLVTTAIMLVSASAASAKMVSGDGLHTFTGGIKFTGTADTNVGSAPAQPGGGAAAGDDEEDEDFSLDEEMDDDALDDIMDDVDTDTEDLSEDDAGDSDGDGTPDIADSADSDGDGNEEIAVGSAPGKGRDDGDERLQTALALKHAYAFDKANGITWKNAATIGVNSQRDRDDLGRRNWAINTGPEFMFKSIGVKVNPSITYMDLDVNHHDQMQSTIASLGSSWKVTKSLALDARYNHEFRNNQKARATDLGVDALKFGTKFVYGKNLFSASYSPKFENNKSGIKDKQKDGYALGYARKLPWKMKLDLGMSYGYTDFTNLTGTGRVDDDRQYTAKLTKNFAHGLYADLGVAHKDKNSNINAKDSNGDSFFVSTGWKF